MRIEEPTVPVTQRARLPRDIPSLPGVEFSGVIRILAR
jgi:hypothetical protein